MRRIFLDMLNIFGQTMIVRRKPLSYSFLILSLVSLMVFGNLQCASNERVSSDSDGYVGSATCKSCHSKEFDEWSGSHHFHAMEQPTDSSVKGDFNEKRFIADGDTLLFYKNNDAFMVRTKNKSGEEEDFEIAYTFGWHPLQQYLVETNNGRLQTLRASWDSEKGKWFNQYSGDTINPGEWLHWTGQSMTWNTMCANCHSTNVKKNYDLEKDAFHTTYSEVTVGCESCHGAGVEHIEAVSRGDLKGAKSLLRMPLDQNSVQQVEECAPCHMRRTASADRMEFDQNLFDVYHPQNINNTFYEPNGQIQEEDYVYGSFVQSKMFHEGVKCTDCHNPHTNALKFDGNRLCLQCHDSEYDAPSHTFHQGSGASTQCVSCHMTGKTYMGNDFRRDHSFRIPRPDQSAISNSSNACNDCHQDKSADWAAQSIEQWYGHKPIENYTDALLIGTPMDASQMEKLVRMFTNPKTPQIARATAAEYILQSGSEDLYSFVQVASTDSSVLTRVEALEALANADITSRLQFGLQFIQDPSATVRMRAALLTADVPTQQIPADFLDAWQTVQDEYVNYLEYNADFREGRMQYGNYRMRTKEYAEAIGHFNMVLKFDSMYMPAYHSLATAQSTIGEGNNAKLTLKKALMRSPQNARSYYLLSLLWNEEGNTSKALLAIEKAMEFDAMNPRYHYNYILLLDKGSQTKKRDNAIREAAMNFPNDQGIIELMEYFKVKR